MSSSRRCPTCGGQAPFADKRLLAPLVQLEERLDPAPSRGRRWRPGRRTPTATLAPELATSGRQLVDEIHSHVHHSHWLTGARSVEELLHATERWLHEAEPTQPKA